MRGIFLVNGRDILEAKSGIGKKIISQADLFTNYGLDCKVISLRTGHGEMPELIWKILFCLPFANIGPIWEMFPELMEVDYIYFRRPPVINFAMRRFLKKLHRVNPKIKVYMEIPTYPYEGEYNTLVLKYFLLRDKYNRKKLRGLIDTVFAIDPMNLLDEFFGVPVVKFINGYDVEHCRIRCFEEHGDKIVLTGVGMLSPWHGYERMIVGLHNYYSHGGDRDIEFNIVGEGSEYETYKKLIEKYNLQDHIILNGAKFGEELDRIYNRTDIGIASLGRYKNGITIIGDLKTREYFAKGIPVVTGCTVDFMQGLEEYPYYMEVPNDNNPIDVSSIVAFYDRVKKNSEEELHNFSYNHFDYNRTLKPIIESIRHS